MEKSNETTHAAPELVNRSSIYTLHRPCDLHHGHDKTSHSGPTTMQHCPDNSAEAKTKSCKHESAPENVIATHVSVNTSTHPKNIAQRSIRVVLLHGVATHTAKDHQRQHVIGTAQDADTETNVRGHRELRQYTWRTNASEHQLSASNPWRKKTNTHEVCPSNDVRTQHKTHMPHDTTTNKPTLLRLAVSRRGIQRHLTSHTDLVCPMMKFPSDMTRIMTDA